MYCYCRAEEVYYTSSQPIPTGGTATGVQFYGRPDVWTEEWADVIYKSAKIFRLRRALAPPSQLLGNK